VPPNLGKVWSVTWYSCLMKIMYAIAVVADLALAVLLVALSGFIFGGGPEGMHGEAGAATVWWASFIVTLAAPILGILLLRRKRCSEAAFLSGC
jgi:hypothetical protein